ncbi:hypothetical protein LSH36_577g03009 [Paralvinella palmiformis]|uniref:Sulfotransferase n=1 Tax=Paralvinella palmiformis TaxID=53620 RepID=A0AAD9MXU3_9ANNE|nr:hypothetical protein LSH36_577g03009 [Paralvinella palmiformis]
MYINRFEKSAKEIYNGQSDGSSSIAYTHQKITVDATPSYYSRQGDLSTLPGNRGLSEPRYTLAHTLYRLFPNTRLIVILRHPTDSMYYPFAKAWLEVFPRKQIIFIKSEDFYSNATATMRNVFLFLGLDPVRRVTANDGHDRYKTGYRSTILPETRDLLDQYFRPLES